jgi:ArsR family transcriptional regulator
VKAPSAPDDWTALAIRALADPLRRRLVTVLRRHEECVSVLAEEVGVTTALASHHLHVLMEAGLVGERREGQWRCYALQPAALELLLLELEELLDPLLPDEAQPGASRCSARRSHGGHHQPTVVLTGDGSN